MINSIKINRTFVSWLMFWKEKKCDENRFWKALIQADKKKDFKLIYVQIVILTHLFIQGNRLKYLYLL